MTLYTLDEIKDEFIGKKGTTKRDLYEQELQREEAKISFKVE